MRFFLGSIFNLFFCLTFCRFISTFSQPGAHPLVLVHSNSVFQKSLCRLLELEILPAMQMLEQQQAKNIERLNELKAKKLQMSK